jgi:hypothetical protein
MTTITTTTTTTTNTTILNYTIKPLQSILYSRWYTFDMLLLIDYSMVCYNNLTRNNLLSDTFFHKNVKIELTCLYSNLLNDTIYKDHLECANEFWSYNIVKSIKEDSIKMYNIKHNIQLHSNNVHILSMSNFVPISKINLLVK